MRQTQNSRGSRHSFTNSNYGGNANPTKQSMKLRPKQEVDTKSVGKEAPADNY